MKKNLNIFAIFAVIFAITYLILSFCIPGWRLKLDAPPAIYFIEQLKSMMLLKCSVSLITGAIAGLAASRYIK